MSSTKPPSAHIAHELLSRAHSPPSTEKLFVEKVKQKPLLLNPTTTRPAADERSQRRLTRLKKKEHFLRKQKPRPLSAKERRVLGVYDIPKEERKYEIYLKLHELWVEYMREILGIGKEAMQHSITVAGHGNLLATADYHGAMIEVVRSKCAGRVGTKGIVVRDTKFTFVVITPQNELKTVPKDHNVFCVQVHLPIPEESEHNAGMKAPSPPPLKFELHGSQFQYRPADRANKKFKWRNLEDV